MNCLSRGESWTRFVGCDVAQLHAERRDASTSAMGSDTIFALGFQTED